MITNFDQRDLPTSLKKIDVNVPDHREETEVLKMIKEELQKANDNFNRRAETEEDFRKDIEGLKKTIVIEITDGETLHMIMENEHMGDVGEGPLEDPDIFISSDTQTMLKLFSGELKAIKAYATKKLKVKASLKDIMIMRKIFA